MRDPEKIVPARDFTAHTADEHARRLAMQSESVGSRGLPGLERIPGVGRRRIGSRALHGGVPMADGLDEPYEIQPRYYDVDPEEAARRMPLDSSGARRERI